MSPSPRTFDRPAGALLLVALVATAAFYLHGAGTFWLGAREKLGGPPQSGERIGFAAEGKPVELSAGAESRELRIVVQPVP